MRHAPDCQVNHDTAATLLVSGKFAVMATPKRLLSVFGVCSTESLDRMGVSAIGWNLHSRPRPELP
jgi:hypothetical protein